MKEEVINQLRAFGYDGNIQYGTETTKNIIKNYLQVTIIKKGNKKLINHLLNNDWQKVSERKISDSGDYIGYSMCIDIKRYY